MSFPELGGHSRMSALILYYEACPPEDRRETRIKDTSQKEEMKVPLSADDSGGYIGNLAAHADPLN